MSLLDGIEVLEDRLEQHVEELSRELIYEFVENHCRYRAFGSCYDGTFKLYNNIYICNEPYYHPSIVYECTQVEIFEDYICPVDASYPILIENYDKPELPSWVKFMFPAQNGYECRYGNGDFAFYHSPLPNPSGKHSTVKLPFRLIKG